MCIQLFSRSKEKEVENPMNFRDQLQEYQIISHGNSWLLNDILFKYLNKYSKIACTLSQESLHSHNPVHLQHGALVIFVATALSDTKR